MKNQSELEAKLRQANIRYGPPPEKDIGLKRPSPDQLRERFAALAAKESSCPSWRRLSLNGRPWRASRLDRGAGAQSPFPQARAGRIPRVLLSRLYVPGAEEWAALREQGSLAPPLASASNSRTPARGGGPRTASSTQVRSVVVFLQSIKGGRHTHIGLSRRERRLTRPLHRTAGFAVRR